MPDPTLDQVHHVIATRPEQYAGYRATLNGNDHNPLRHKVFEISPIKPVVTEFQPYVLREFVSMSQNANKTVWLYGYILLNTGRLLMRQWKRYKGGDLSRERLKEVAQGKRRLIEANLKVVGEEAAKEGGVVRKLLKHFESLWVFVEQEVVELTNTVMERALRHAVIWRKTRFGSESELGLRFTEGALAYLELLNGRRIPSPPTSKTCSQVHPNPSSLLPYSRECLRGMYENHPGTGQYLRTQQHEEVAVNHGVQA